VPEVRGGGRRSEDLSFHVWIDAQLPPSLAYWLKTEQGVNAVHLESLGLHAVRDREIVERAKLAEHPVVLVTKDEDFRRLLELRGVPPQVVWLRCGNTTNKELRRIVLAAWPRAISMLTAGEPLVEIRRHRD